MTQLFSNVLLAFIWAAITGTINLPNLIIGFFLGYIVMMIAAPAIDSYSYTRRMRKGIFFILYFLKELVVSSVRVAIDVLRPSFNMESGIVAIPLTAKTDFEKTMLANCISLTPGTLSLELSEDGHTLYIHAMYIDNGDVEAVRREIKEGMEHHILEVTRP